MKQEQVREVWSAAPTPLNEKMDLDIPSIERMMAHHFRLGINGLFLLGSNGEGPWLANYHRRMLVREVIAHNVGGITIAVQVTDNSAGRMLENVSMAKEEGADIAVIAPPYFLPNSTSKSLCALYLEVIEKSSLPIGIYDRGTFGPVVIPESVLKTVYSHKKVVMVKDSSTNIDHMKLALGAKKKRPNLSLLNGWEFNCVDYLKAGYDGLLLGGGVFNGYLARQIVNAVAVGDNALAKRLQNRMNRMMWDVYGGKKITCWLAGEKELLVEMGIFTTHENLLNYTLTKSCSKAIKQVLKRDRELLLP